MDGRPPYRSYATILGTFLAGLGLTGRLAASRDRDPQCHTALDFADRDFGNVMSGEPTAPLPGRWAYTPKPFNDHAYDVRSRIFRYA